VWGTIETNDGTTTSAIIVGNEGQEVSSMSYSYTQRTGGTADPRANKSMNATGSSSDNPYTREIQAAMAQETRSETKSVKNVRFATDKSKNNSSSTGGPVKKEALSGMMWETASQGGASRIPKKYASKNNRANVFQKRGQYIPEEVEGQEED